jgi:hypothetical protein
MAPKITATPDATHSMRPHFSFRNDMGTTSFPHNLFIYGSLNNVVNSSDSLTVNVMLMSEHRLGTEGDGRNWLWLNSRQNARICLKKLQKTAKYTYEELATKLRFLPRHSTCNDGMLPTKL